MTIEQVTVAFLVGVFVVAELQRALRGIPAVIVSVDGDSSGLVDLPVRTVMVRLSNGDVVRALLSSCTACLGRLRVGDEVRVTNSRDGYVVDLPWFRRTTCRKSRGN